MMIQNRDDTKVRESSSPPRHLYVRRSYYAEVPVAPFDEQSRLLDKGSASRLTRWACVTRMCGCAEI